MEESESRRERLKAMREEAAQGAGADSGSSRSGSQGLRNPLAESETSALPSQYTKPRFDFYTDPTAAFSNKRKHNTSPQVTHGHTPPRPVYPDMVQSPAHLYPAIRSPHDSVIHAQTGHYNTSALGGPVQASNTFAPRGNPPGAWGGSSAVNYSYPPNISQDSNYQSPGFRRGDSSFSTYGRGRGQRNNSTHYDPGRGRGRWQENRMSPGPVWNGRGGEGGSTETQFRSYYRKEMVEDPWKMVQLSPWKGIAPRVSNNSWTSKPIQLKKAKVSSESSHSSASKSKPSLAEYLASSFNEPATEPAADEPST